MFESLLERLLPTAACGDKWCISYMVGVGNCVGAVKEHLNSCSNFLFKSVVQKHFNFMEHKMF